MCGRSRPVGDTCGPWCIAITVRWLDDEGAVVEERGLVVPAVPAGESRWEATGLVPHFESERAYGSCLARLEVAIIAQEPE